MIKLGACAVGATLIAVGTLSFIIGIHAFEIAGALCIERE